MARLKWGEGLRQFDLGLDRGVLYLDDTAVPWNGLVSIAEQDTAPVSTDYYFEGKRLVATQSMGDFEAKFSAYTYPDIFAEYNGYGSREEYKRFGMSYRTEHGDGHRLHIVYNVMVRQNDRSWLTLSEKANLSLFDWDIFASAIPIPNTRPASRFIVEVPQDESLFGSVEDILYGTDTTDPRLPDPEELVELYEAATLLRIIYNGDGTYTATGPDDMVHLLDDGRFELSAPSVFLISQDIFVANSY